VSDSGEKRRCPNCAEFIQVSAIICRFCQSGLSLEHFRTCPFCAEMINRESKLCFYCKSNVPALVQESPQEILAEGDQLKLETKASSKIAPLKDSEAKGLIFGALSEDGKYACLLEINCETNFQARSIEVKELSVYISEKAVKSKFRTLNDLLASAMNQRLIEKLVQEVSTSIGEKVLVKRFAAINLESGYGSLGLYLHPNYLSPMGAIVQLKSDKVANQSDLDEIARELAMHIVVGKPKYIGKGEITEAVIEQLGLIESGEPDVVGKKPEVRDEIMARRIKLAVIDFCLLEQRFVKDPSISVGKYLELRGGELGVELRPIQFRYFHLGED
jgi:elongation factor Ts